MLFEDIKETKKVWLNLLKPYASDQIIYSILGAPITAGEIEASLRMEEDTDLGAMYIKDLLDAAIELLKASAESYKEENSLSSFLMNYPKSCQ